VLHFKDLSFHGPGVHQGTIKCSHDLSTSRAPIKDFNPDPVSSNYRCFEFKHDYVLLVLSELSAPIETRST